MSTTILKPTGPIDQRKLGKMPPKLDRRTLQLAKYIKALAPPPESASYIQKIGLQGWPMMLNDMIGDCTVATSGHMMQQWTAYASQMFVPSDKDILRAYMDVSGYIPGNPWSDQGAYILDVLNYWRRRGIANHQIDAYAQVTIGDVQELKQAVQIFGNCYIGVWLPVTAQDQWQRWYMTPHWRHDPEAAPGTWGGHAVPVVAYNPEYLWVVTWGKLMQMSWNFYRNYCDEAYAVLSHDWISASGRSPSGFDFQQLADDLSAISDVPLAGR